jgi:cytochrome c nitrite reductase small subunit
MSAGAGAATLPALALVALAGVAAGVGATTFVYARGSSYLTDDPSACANCHVMQAHYDAWRKGPHHQAAVCNDCHVPAGAYRWVAKLGNGWRHSAAFTTGDYPDAILLRPAGRKVVEDRCRACHADLVASMEGGGEVSCLRCHDSVGHLR